MVDASQALGAASAYQTLLADLRNSRSLLEGSENLDPIAAQQLNAILNGRPQATAGPAETVRTDAHVQLLAGRAMRLESFAEAKQLPTADNVRESSIDRDPRLLFNGASYIPEEDLERAAHAPLRDGAWNLQSAAAPLPKRLEVDASIASVDFVPAAEFERPEYPRAPIVASPAAINVEDLTTNTLRVANDVVANSFRQLRALPGEKRAEYFARCDPYGTDLRSYTFPSHPVHYAIARNLRIIEGMASEMRDHHTFNLRPNADSSRPTWKTVVREVQVSRAARSFDQLLHATCAALFRFMNNFPSEPLPRAGAPYYSDFCDYYRAALTDSFSARNEARLR